MRKFGSFETVQELFRGGLGSVFSARREGASGAPTFVVKTCEPVAEILGEAQAKASVAAFLERARDQQRAAAAKGGGAGGESHWAAVHDVGETPYGAYLVTDLFDPGSIERLSMGRVRVEPRAMRHLLGGMAAGLAELEAACGRPHGNLRPSNVLIAGTGALEGARVALSDPGAASQIDADHDRAEDLRALGRVLYQLVFHQPLRDGTLLPLPPAPEWEAMGRAGEQWRELCSRLLEPEGGAAPLTLQGVIAQIEGMSSARAGGGGKKVAIAIASAVVVMGGIGGVLVMRGGGGGAAAGGGAPVQSDIPFDAENWAFLCEAYWGWFLDFEEKARSPERRARLAKDEHLRGLLGAMDQGVKAGPGLNPLAITGLAEHRTLQSLVRSEVAPDEARSGEAIRATAAAAGVIRAVQAGLTPEAWPALGKLRAGAEAFGERGWEGARRVIVEEVIAPAEPKRAALLAEALERVIATGAVVESIQGRWAKIEATGEALGATKDVVLARFVEWARADAVKEGAGAAAGGADALRELDRRLAEVEKLGEQLRAFVRPGGEWDKVDQESFRESRVHTALAAGRELDAGLFRDWLFEAPSFPVPDLEADPRRGWRVAQGDEGDGGAREPAELADARRLATDMRDYLAGKGRAMEPEDAARAARVTELAASAAEVGRLRWTAANRSRIESEAGAIAREAGELRRALDTRLATMRTDDAQGFAQAAEHWRGRAEVSASPALNELWRARRDAMIAGLEAGAGGGDASALRREAEALLAQVDSLEKALPAATLPAEVAGSVWATALTAEAAQARESVLAAALRGLKPGEAITESVAAAVAQQGGEQYRQHVAALVDLAQRGARLEGLLSEGYGLGERPAAEGQTAGEIIGAIERALAARSSATLSAAMRPLLERANQVGAIAASGDRAALAQQVRAARADLPAQALAAWRRLGELSWPADLAELEQERELREALGRVLGTLGDTSRRETLSNEVAAQTLARFERAAAALTRPEELETALGLLPRFGLEAGSLQDPGLRFNARLHGLRRELVAGGAEMSEERALELVEGFLGEVRALVAGPLSGEARAGEVVTALDEMAKSARQRLAGQETRPRVDLTKLGPGALGGAWAAEVVQDGAEVVYRHAGSSADGEGPLELRFVRVSAEEGKTAYLLANEVSLGQLVGIVNGTSKWAEMGVLLRPEEPRDGPTGWRADGAVITRSTHWTQGHPQLREDRRAYPPELRDPSDFRQISREQGWPSMEMPVQQVPVGAAMYLARLVGCRLPTGAEWAAAAQGAGATADLNASNLRDATWEKQRAYVQETRAAMSRQGIGGGQFFEWPDTGAFVAPVGRRDIPTSERATARGTDDGVLWFAPAVVDDPRPFHHLVGNVAEFVFDDPAALEALPAADAEAFERFADMNGAKVGVVGGSALSPPELGVDVVARPDPMDAAFGFSDVGVRLAFTADGASAAERVATAALRQIRPGAYVLGR